MFWKRVRCPTMWSPPTRKESVPVNTSQRVDWSVYWNTPQLPSVRYEKIIIISVRIAVSPQREDLDLKIEHHISRGDNTKFRWSLEIKGKMLQNCLIWLLSEVADIKNRLVTLVLQKCYIKCDSVSTFMPQLHQQGYISSRQHSFTEHSCIFIFFS